MIVLDNKDEQIADYRKMVEHEKSFSHSISELGKLDVWNEKEKGALAEAQPLTQIASDGQGEAMKLVLNNKVHKAKGVLKYKIIPSQVEKLAKLDNLLEVHKDEIEEIIQLAKENKSQFLLKLTLMTSKK